MKILLRLDLFLWNYFIPNVKAKIFKNRLIALLAMVYVSMYRLPRMFLMNYFSGKGNEMLIDTKEFLTSNYVVLNKLIEAISISRSDGLSNDSIDICQTDVYDPNYKYAIGSFRIDYALNNQDVIITVSSIYRFGLYSDRITKHLHRWLYSLEMKGYAKEFNIEGTPWFINSSKLISSKMDKQTKNAPIIKFLI